MERNTSWHPPQATLVVDLFPELLNELLSLLSALSAADWRRPTACPGWSVKDVALHLLGDEIGNLSWRRDGFSLEPSISSWGQLVRDVNRRNQDWVRGAQRLSPRLLIDLLELTGLQMNDHFQTLDPFSQGGSVSWAGPHPAPVWLDLAREYTERWHHQQHIRDAVGKPGLKEPRYMAPVISAFIWALPRAYRSSHASENTSVTLTITGESGGRWSVIYKSGEWKLYQGAPDQPDAEVILDQDAAWRLFTCGLKRDAARKQLSLKGDHSLGLKVLGMVAIIA